VPLTAVNFVNKGPVLHADLLQFYNLFTGVMIDQPVTFKNAVSIGGSQGISTVPLRLYGTTGQSGHLIDLYTDPTQAQPGFGFSALGSFGWGPGGTAGQDTFLSRVARQNGHASDTAGLLVQPYLEVMGTVQATGLTSLGGASITGALSAGSAAISGTLTAGATTITGLLTVTGNVNAYYLTTSDGSNGVVQARNGSLYLRSSGGANSVIIDTGSGGLTVPAGPINTTGALSVGGNATISGGTLTVSSANSGILYLGDAAISRWNPQQIRFMGNSGITIAAGNLAFENAGSQIVFASGGTLSSSASPARLVTNVPFAPFAVTDGGTGGNINLGSPTVNGVLSCNPTWGVIVQSNVAKGAILFSDNSGTGLYLGLQSDSANGGYHFVGYNKLYAQQWIIEGSSYAYITLGRSANEIALDVHAITQGDHYVNGTLSAGNVINRSSRVLKSDILGLNNANAMARVMDPRVGPVTFQAAPSVQAEIDARGIPPNGYRPYARQVGFLAEDMQYVVPEAVAYDATTSEATGINYGALTAILWAALRDLNTRAVAFGI
jgi:hypothetical protein